MINSDYSLLSTLVGNSGALRSQLAQVQEQVASGQVSSTYSGLGNQARTSLDLNPQIQHYATWQANISAAQGQLSVTQTALSSINTIASQFFAQVNSINTSNGGNVASLAQDAKNALQQVAGLVNSKSGNVYVFAGTDSSNPPLPSTDPSVLSTALLASSTSQAPFSSTLTSSVPQIQVGNNQWVKVGLLANSNTLATSSQPTTGSYMRDIMTALAGLSGLTNSSTTADITSAVSTARGLLNSGITAESTEAGALGNVQSSLLAQQTELSQTSTALTTQLASVQNVDPAKAITQASALQTQLQASYQIIAESQNMSLANYIQA